MGKEGYWGGRSFKRSSEAETPSGCMCAFFQFFDFHPFHFSSIQHHQQTAFNSACDSQNHCDTPTIPKGTEAPRNSLESEDGTMASISKEKNLKIPKNNILFIKTSTGISSRAKLGNLNDLSPGTKTPTLVARLMGLDLLPDAQSPSSSSPSSSSTTTTTTSSSCLSASKSQANINPHLHHLKPRQNNIQTKPRHSMDDSITAASRSLPETPRISSARRSDVEHRLSLQINKENMGIGEELELPRLSFSKLKFEEHSGRSSASHYAKQIVKQMKESVSRKAGTDVTNTVKNREQARGGGEFVGQFRSKKSPRTPTSTVSKVVDELSSLGKVSNNPPSCSPTLRFMEPKNNKPSTATTTHTTAKDQISPQPVKLDNNNQPQLSRVLTKAKPQDKQKELQKQQSSSSSVPKCKKAANERFSPRLKKPLKTSDVIRNKQEESFVRPLLSSPTRANDIKTSKSRRSHPLLINLNAVQNINSNSNNLPVKTDPSPPATKIPQKQVCGAREPKCSSQLSSGSRQTYTKEATSCILSTRESNVDQDKRKSGSMCDDDGPEFEYVTSILSRTGLVKGTTASDPVSVSFHHWFSPTNPLDPSIFHHLEQEFQYPTSSISTISFQDRNLRSNNDLGLLCNRRLVFDLVDEILLENLGPYDETRGSLLVETVCERIGRLQGAKCEVLEDIDALIEMEDMGKMKMQSAEAMVAEIEGNIMDTLLHETIMVTECW